MTCLFLDVEISFEVENDWQKNSQKVWNNKQKHNLG